MSKFVSSPRLRVKKSPQEELIGAGLRGVEEDTVGRLPKSRATAEIQRRTRKAHARERAEDYVEAIAALIDSGGEARAVDIARMLGVTHVTVIRTVERLQREGLVTTRPYRSIFLTDLGRRLAAKSKARHEKVLSFLMALGVPPAVAALDAEGIEHHVSPRTLAAFEAFLKKQPGAPDSGGSLEPHSRAKPKR